jgi:activating signal cointegrator 1
MKAISLWQPWASLWLSPAKIHETRHWPTRYRGMLVVHAAKRKIDEDIDALAVICSRLFGDDYAKTLPRGALLGVVDLVDCVPTQTKDWTAAASLEDETCGDFSEGRFAWRREGFVVFERPIPWRGMQGLFEVPDNGGEQP